MKYVLVVDDNEQNLYYLRALLTANGITVDLAHHGAEALVKARRQTPDLVISDLLMPVMDGYTLLRHWKADDQLKSVPFVVYTATYRGDKDQQLAFDLGAAEFILKPEEPDQFLRKIRAVQNRAASDAPAGRGRDDESGLLRDYSETLIRKLEEKSLKLQEKTSRLEEANFALQRELVERNQIEKILRLSESRLDQERARLLDAQRLAKMGSWETDIVTGAVQWSDETHRIFETVPGSYSPTHSGFLILVHPEDRERVDRAFTESLQESGSYALEHRLLLPSGAVKYIDERWRVSKDTTGKPIRALGTCHDITDRKIAEAELRKTTELLKAVADGTPDAVFVKDLQGRYLLFNAAAARLVGKPVDQVIGNDDTALFEAESARELMQSDHQVMASGETSFSEEVLTAAGITRTYDVTKAPYRDSFGQVIGLIGISRDISTRKLQEQAQRAQSMMLESAQRIGRMGSWSLEVASGRLEWSAATCELFGITSVEFSGTLEHFHSFMLPEDLRTWHAAHSRVTPDRPMLETEYRVRRPDGQIRWMYERGVVEFNNRGDRLRQIGMVMDITERKSTTERLTLSSSLLRIAGRLARVGGWSLRMSDWELTWSDEICHIHEVPPGYKPNVDEAYHFYPVEYRSQVQAHIDALVQDGVPYEFESPLITAKGRRLWVRSIGEAVRDEEGRICQVQGGFQDITEQRLAAETIRESEERFRLLARATNDAVRDWYMASNEVWWNEGVETLFGFSRHELEDSLDSWSKRIHPDDRQGIVEQLQAAIEGGGEVWTGTYRFARRDGSYAHVWDRVTVIRDANGAAIRMLGGMTDISEQRRAESALQASLVELNRRNRELQEFAFVASHDLQEPLRKIRTFSELLVTRHREALDGQAGDYVDRMHHAATRMQTLIKDLLEYSRATQGAQPFGQTDLARVCHEVLMDLEPRIEASGARIVVDDLPTINADATQMRQLLQNLLSNALKFHDSRRKPEISVVAQFVRLNGAPACRLVVADNGIGFEEKFAEGIFNPFQRLHARTEFEGTGIGLAIVRRIVERHHGTIEAFSKPGLGTKFVVTLPVTANLNT